MNRYDTKEYKRSRRAYVLQCAVEYFVSLLVTDAFLAKLLTSIGISDALTGVISSFITLAFVMQLFSLFFFRKQGNIKRLVMIFDTLSVFFFMILYIIPFMPLGQTGKTICTIVSVLFAYVGQYLVLSVYYQWGNSFVDPSHRAEFSAKKEMLSLFLGMLVTAAAGCIIDRYEGIGNLNGGFLFLAVSIFILNICNFICLSQIRGESYSMPEAEEKKSFRDILNHTIGNRTFCKIILLSVIWDAARYFSFGFMGVFKTNDLMMSMVFVQVINILACFARLLLSIPFGRYSDRYSFAKGFRLALGIAAVAFGINMFTTPRTWYLIVVYTVLYQVCLAGVNQNSFNITYNYVDASYVAEAMAVKNSLSGLCGFAASVLGGKVLAYVQSHGNSVFGMELYGQQILSGISLLLTLAAILFVRYQVETEKVKIQ